MTDKDETAETETDGYQFRWWRQWRERDPYGGLRDHAELHALDGTEQLGEARVRHAADRKGRWVKAGMIDPHVTALRVHEDGRPLSEELAPKADLDTPAEQHSLV